MGTVVYKKEPDPTGYTALHDMPVRVQVENVRNLEMLTKTQMGDRLNVSEKEYDQYINGRIDFPAERIRNALKKLGYQVTVLPLKYRVGPESDEKRKKIIHKKISKLVEKAIPRGKEVKEIDGLNELPTINFTEDE